MDRNRAAFEARIAYAQRIGAMTPAQARAGRARWDYQEPDQPGVSLDALEDAASGTLSQDDYDEIMGVLNQPAEPEPDPDILDTSWIGKRPA